MSLNLGGIVDFWFVDINGVDRIADVINNSIEYVLLKPGYEWQNLKCINKQVGYKKNHNNSGTGRVFQLNATYVSHSSAEYFLFSEMTKNKYLVKIKFKTGDYYILGNKKNPVRFQFSNDGGSSVKVYTINFSISGKIEFNILLNSFITPKQLNPILWLDSTKGVNTSTVLGVDYVDSWEDQGSSGNDAVQTTGANRPILDSNGVLFNKTNSYYLNLSNIVTLDKDKCTLFLKFKQISDVNTSIRILGNSESSTINYFYLWGSPEKLLIEASTNGDYWCVSAGGTIYEDTEYMATILAENGFISTSLNGNLINNGAGGSDILINIIGGAGSSGLFNGYIYHLLIYDKVLTSDEITEVQIYLNNI
jgi:hypothetical protein